MSDPIPVNEPWEGYGESIPEGGPAWNRAPGRTAADVNLDGAPFGFKVTGDAAWDLDSDEGEAAVLTWIGSEKEQMAADTAERPSRRAGHVITGMSEIRDTMVRETISYALDEAWVQAYGHRFGEEP